eukprot:SAG22_NODE_1270_length_4942_cov_72.777623_1_plen_466_part_10
MVTSDSEEYEHILEDLELGPDKSVLFTVQASNDAHIGFFSSNLRTAEVYEVVLSGWDNARSAIRESKQGDNRVTAGTAGLLSDDEPRPFWASAVDGLVRVGQGHVIGQRVLMQWQDPDHHVAMHVGLMTGWGSHGRWRVCTGGPDADAAYDDGDYDFWGEAEREQPFNGTYNAMPAPDEWASLGQAGAAVLSASGASPALQPAPPPPPPSVMTRAPPLPPPPAPVVLEVATKVYSAQEQQQAATELTAAFAAASLVDEDDVAATEVQVSSTLAFPVAIEAIAEGSPVRQQFELGFRVSMAQTLGGGRAITADKIVVDGITGGGRRQRRRRRLLESDGRRRLQTVDVDFHIAAPAAVAPQAASLVTTLASTSTPIVVTVAGRSLSADTSALTAPVVLRPPDVDCLGSWSGCGADCGTKFFVYTVTPSGDGRPCPHSHGDAQACAGGDGACTGSSSSDGTTEVNTMVL